MKRVVVLSTGGTIASLPGPDGRNVAGAISGEDLVAKLAPGLDIQLEVRSLFQKPSNSLTIDDLLVLRATCQEIIDAGQTDGIVITHGTDTLEESAYFLECCLQSRDTVVVLTGAQRVPHALGSDSATNLRHAIDAASSHQCRGLGVLVVFNETIHAAAFVRKTSSFQLNGFESPPFGCLGFVDAGHVMVYQQPRRQALLLPQTTTLPRVEMLNLGLDSSALALGALIDAGVAAIVIEGTGRGQVPPSWVSEVRRATAAGIHVLVCSATLHGAVLPCYEYPGSLHDLQQAGALGVSGLSARKLRIRLMLVLASLGADIERSALAAMFTWGAPRD